jgi:hypothetical protein
MHPDHLKRHKDHATGGARFLAYDTRTFELGRCWLCDVVMTSHFGPRKRSLRRSGALSVNIGSYFVEFRA